MATRRIRIRRNAVRFRITRAGWLFLLVSVLVGLAAVRTQGGLMYILFGGMMGAMHVSALIARRMLGPLHVSREGPTRIWQNQTVHFGYFMRNARKRGACLGIAIDQAAPEDVETAGGYCAHLPPAGTFRAGARFVARRRGRARLGDFAVSTSFPFGLVEARRRFPDADTLVIWPARGRLKRRLLHHGAVDTSTAAPSPVTGGQDEFFGLREYRQGDNPRWIHWRRSAGRVRPVLREMSRPLPEILWVILDTRAANERSRAARERRIRLAGTLIDHALARGYEVGLSLAYSSDMRCIPPDSGRGQRRDLLDALADVDDNAERDVADAAALVPRGGLRESQIVILAGRPPEADLLRALRFAGRSLRTVTDDRIEEYFIDDPLVAEGN